MNINNKKIEPWQGIVIVLIVVAFACFAVWLRKASIEYNAQQFKEAERLSNGALNTTMMMRELQKGQDSGNTRYTPPSEQDAGRAYLDAFDQQWTAQCEELVRRTGRPCNCNSENLLCITALGGVPDIKLQKGITGEQKKEFAQNMSSADNRSEAAAVEAAASRLFSGSGAALRDRLRMMMANQLHDAIEQYRADHNAYPPAIEEMPILNATDTDFYSCTNGERTCPVEICSRPCANGLNDVLNSLKPYLIVEPGDALATPPGTGYALAKVKDTNGKIVVTVAAKYHETTPHMIVAPSDVVVDWPTATTPPPSPPVEVDAGRAYTDAIDKRWTEQCEELVQRTGRPCNCNSENLLCITALGGVPDIKPPIQ